jgi:tetratricopeptide (TPR) repeat protein
VTVFLSLGLAARAAGAELGVEVTSPHFVVHSDAGEAAARAMAVRAERVRATYARIWPWARVDTGAPIFLLAATRSVFRGAVATIPQAEKIPGWHSHGPERHYFLVHAGAELKNDDRGVNFSLFSGYASLILAQNFARNPRWMDLGLQQLFGLTLVRTDDVEIGHPPLFLKWSLTQSEPVPLARLLESDDSSAPLKRDVTMIGQATSWAFTHWLVIDQSLARNVAAGQFLKLLAEGVDALPALRQAGLDPAKVDTTVQAYLRQGEFRAVSLPVAQMDGSQWPVRQLSNAEWQALVALYSIEVGRSAAAQAAERSAREALRGEPGLTVAHEALARALWVQPGHLGEVRSELEAARKATPDRLSTRYLSAEIERDLSDKPEASGQEIERGVEHARRAVALGPDFAPAHSLLADLLLRKGDSLTEALALARRAASLEPGLPTHRLILAKALARSGDSAGARSACELVLASRPEEGLKKQAEQLLASLPPISTPSTQRE